MMLRAFIAIELPPEIQASIARSTADIQKALPKPVIRWIVPQNLHLTLKFLGDISPANLKGLAEALKVELEQNDAFPVSVGGLGAFPTPHRPRIIWIGLDAPAALSVLQRNVESVAARMGYPPEERPFSPHLTIGRVGQRVNAADIVRIRTAIEGTRIGQLGTFRADMVHIFKSDLQPSGSIYTHLYALPLKS